MHIHYAPPYISSDTPETYVGKVVGITDGDTLTLLVDRQQVKCGYQRSTPQSAASPSGHGRNKPSQTLPTGRRPSPSGLVRTYRA